MPIWPITGGLYHVQWSMLKTKFQCMAIQVLAVLFQYITHVHFYKIKKNTSMLIKMHLITLFRLMKWNLSPISLIDGNTESS